MSGFGYTVLGFGTIATTAVSAPSSIIIEDTYNDNSNGGGTGTGTQYIDLRYTQPPGARGASSATINVQHNATVAANFDSGGTFQILAGVNYTGAAPTSFSWVLSESGGAGTLANSLSNTPLTTPDTTTGTSGDEPTISLGSISSGNSGTFNVVLTGTNAGGSTASATFVFTIAIS
jgi:hypothetical protein